MTMRADICCEGQFFDCSPYTFPPHRLELDPEYYQHLVYASPTEQFTPVPPRMFYFFAYITEIRIEQRYDSFEPLYGIRMECAYYNLTQMVGNRKLCINYCGINSHMMLDMRIDPRNDKPGGQWLFGYMNIGDKMPFIVGKCPNASDYVKKLHDMERKSCQDYYCSIL